MIEQLDLLMQIKETIATLPLTGEDFLAVFLKYDLTSLNLYYFLGTQYSKLIYFSVNL